MTPAAEYREVLEFWYSDRVRAQWFSSTRELDAEIRAGFEGLWRHAAVGTLRDWQGCAEGALALVILLDQFPLNMFRGKAESFSTEGLSREVAREAIRQGFDKQLPADRLAFLYMPFMHSEDIADQELSVRLFENSGLEANIRFARHHREIIRRFGRFPHRNQILSRTSTAAELEYLASERGFTG